MSLQEIFDQQDFPWAQRPEHVHARVALLKAALGQDPRPPRMLDLGCGPGENTLAVAEGLGAGHVVGQDWSPRALASARTKSLSVVQAPLDGVDLPFAGSTFDVVVLSEVIEHLVDTDRVFDEAFRVLIPGGAFLVTTPNLAAWFNRVLLVAGVQPVFSEVSGRKVFGRPGRDVVGHLRLFTRRALVEMLHEAGFIDIRLSGVAFHGVPRPARPLDRFLARWPEVAATLLAVSSKPR